MCPLLSTCEHMHMRTDAHSVQKRSGSCGLPDMGAGIQTLDHLDKQHVLLTMEPNHSEGGKQFCMLFQYKYIVLNFCENHRLYDN